MGSVTGKSLEDIWCRILGTDGVSSASNFFLEGGDSRTLIGLALAIREELGVDVPITAIFEAQSFGELRAEVDRRRELAADSRTVATARR